MIIFNTMKNVGLIILFFLLSLQPIFCQESAVKSVDSLYKEDQFYAGITYDLLGKIPTGISQRGFSFGFHVGFIKDMPINKKRNVALGIGLGFSLNSFNQNLLINKDATGNYTYTVLDDVTTYSKNKFSEHLVEIPFEFRWRTSTPTDYKFWRVYTGFKIGYLLSSRSKYVGDLGTLKYHGIPDFNKFQYGLTLSAGYNTWNFYVYYALNPLLSKNAALNGQPTDMNAVKIGLMFYVL